MQLLTHQGGLCSIIKINNKMAEIQTISFPIKNTMNDAVICTSFTEVNAWQSLTMEHNDYQKSKQRFITVLPYTYIIDLKCSDGAHTSH